MNSFYGNGGGGGVSANQINNIIKQAIVVSQDEPVGQQTGNLWIKITEKDDVTILWPSYVLTAGADGVINVMKNNRILSPEEFTISSPDSIIEIGSEIYGSNYFVTTEPGNATIVITIDGKNYNSKITIGDPDSQPSLVIAGDIYVLSHAMSNNNTKIILQNADISIFEGLLNASTYAPSNIKNAEWYCFPVTNENINAGNAIISNEFIGETSIFGDISGMAAQATITGTQEGMIRVLGSITLDDESTEGLLGKYNFASDLYVSNDSFCGMWAAGAHPSETPMLIPSINIDGIDITQGYRVMIFDSQKSIQSFTSNWKPIESGTYSYQIADSDIAEITNFDQTHPGFYLTIRGKQIGNTTLTLTYNYQPTEYEQYYDSENPDAIYPIVHTIPISVTEPFKSKVFLWDQITIAANSAQYYPQFIDIDNNSLVDGKQMNLSIVQDLNDSMSINSNDGYFNFLSNNQQDFVVSSEYDGISYQTLIHKCYNCPFIEYIDGNGNFLRDVSIVDSQPYIINAKLAAWELNETGDYEEQLFDDSNITKVEMFAILYDTNDNFDSVIKIKNGNQLSFSSNINNFELITRISYNTFQGGDGKTYSAGKCISHSQKFPIGHYNS